MKKIFLIFIAIFLVHAFLFSTVPDWIVNLEKVFPSEQYIRVIGEGDTEDIAKRNSLTELGAYFSQTVETVTKAHLEMYNGAHGNTSNRSIQIQLLLHCRIRGVHHFAFGLQSGKRGRSKRNDTCHRMHGGVGNRKPCFYRISYRIQAVRIGGVRRIQRTL